MPDRRLPGARGARVTLVFDGREYKAFEGETVAMALWAAGVRGIRTSAAGVPRGMLCAMGVCYECLVDVDGRPVRACLQPVRGPRMVVNRRGRSDGTPP
ncbi:MAG TPA: (2Fe-2S)-binding protein [Planctomycetota bacterium]|nr:(2Fe-2S)-binding protein [Planctomycetota bacterium]